LYGNKIAQLLSTQRPRLFFGLRFTSSKQFPNGPEALKGNKTGAAVFRAADRVPSLRFGIHEWFTRIGAQDGNKTRARFIYR